MTHGPAMKASGAPPPMNTPRPIGILLTDAGPPSALGRSSPLAGIDEAPEQGMGLHGLRLELGMELAGEEVRMIRDLDDFHEAPVGRLAGDAQSAPRHLVEIGAVDFVAVPVPLAYLGAPVGLVGKAVLLDQAGPLAEPHVATHPRNTVELFELVDHGMGRPRAELRGVGVLETADVARELDHGALQAEADPEEGDFLLASVADSFEHAGNPSDAEPAWHEDAV